MLEMHILLFQLDFIGDTVKRLSRVSRETLKFRLLDRIEIVTDYGWELWKLGLLQFCILIWLQVSGGLGVDCLNENNSRLLAIGSI